MQRTEILLIALLVGAALWGASMMLYAVNGILK